MLFHIFFKKGHIQQIRSISVCPQLFRRVFQTNASRIKVIHFFFGEKNQIEVLNIRKQITKQKISSTISVLIKPLIEFFFFCFFFFQVSTTNLQQYVVLYTSTFLIKTFIRNFVNPPLLNTVPVSWSLVGGLL